MATGVRRLGKGLFSGVTGLVEAPIRVCSKAGFLSFFLGQRACEGRAATSTIILLPSFVQGAKKGGFLGGVAGVGKGVVGVFTKPATGISDMVSSTLQGIEAQVRKFLWRGI